MEHNTKPHELVEKVITDKFLNTCVAATNAHREEDEEFTKLYPDDIPEDESGRALLKPYLAIEWHLLLLGYKRREWAWSVDSLKSQEKIKDVMRRKTYSLPRKHFRTVDHRGLPNRDDLSYHPLQNILNGVNYRRELWSTGLEMTNDEGRVKSKSKRNGYRVFNAKKPVREGWTIYMIIRCCLKLSVRGSKKPMQVQVKVTI